MKNLKSINYLFFVVLMIVLWGCPKSNTTSTVTIDSGKVAEEWSVNHPLAQKDSAAAKLAPIPGVHETDINDAKAMIIAHTNRKDDFYCSGNGKCEQTISIPMELAKQFVENPATSGAANIYFRHGKGHGNTWTLAWTYDQEDDHAHICNGLDVANSGTSKAVPTATTNTNTTAYYYTSTPCVCRPCCTQ